MTQGVELTPRLREVLAELPALVVVMRGPDLVVELANPRRQGLPQGSALEGLPAADMLDRALASDADRARLLEQFRAVRDGQGPHRQLNAPVHFAGGAEPTYWDLVLLPLHGDTPEAAGVLVFATDVTPLAAARHRTEQAEHRFTTLFDANVIGVTIVDERRILESNDAFLTMIGRTRAELDAGLDWMQLTAPEYAGHDERADRALRSEGAVAPYEKAYLRPDGSRVPVLISGTRLSTDPFRVLATSYDLSARNAAEAKNAALLARTRRLQEITATLSASNSAGAIARAVVHHGLEELSASAGLLALREGEWTVEHAIGFDREQIEQWRRFPATMPTELRAPSARALPAGEMLEGGTVVAVAVTGADGATLGTVALAFRGRRALNQADLDFLVALAWQTGLALDRTRLYEDRAYVARKLQEGLLPDRLASVDGLEAAVVYESISGGGEVGGDFYDLFEAAPGRWLACVGDVCGKGTEAAVITGLARHTVRAIGQVRERPSDILAFLNRSLRGHGALPAFCTVGCAAIEPDGDGFAVRLASGGHPFPLVLRSNGELEEIEVIGTMLGASSDPELDEVGIRIGRGDALILYTDGVIDARRIGGERFGEERMLDAIRGAAGCDAEGIAAAVEAAVREHLPGSSADDRAVMVLRAR